MIRRIAQKLVCVAALAAMVACATTEEAPPAPAPAPAPSKPAPAPAAPSAAPAPAPAPAPVAQPAPQPAKPKPLRVFTHVTFAFDKSVLDMSAQDKLDREVVVRFGEYSDLRFININGYTDRIGSVQYNQKLSERRAAAVKAYLVRQGADAAKIETTGYGKMYMGAMLPVAQCTQKDLKALIACLAPNRRAEVEVLGTGR
jgi:OOP family OmpA-OmpF porin